MKKERSRSMTWWLIALSLILVLSFAGCGNDRLFPAGSSDETKVLDNPDQAALAAAGTQWASVFAARGHFGFALKYNGTLWAVGDNTSGQLGTGDTNSRATFVQVLSNVKDVAAGDNFCLALRKDNTVWGTGSNQSGQLGLGDNVKSTTRFVQVLNNVTQVAAGSYHSLALQGFTVLAAGQNDEGQLGTGDTRKRTTFVPVMSDGFRIAAGNHFSLVIWSPTWVTGHLFTTGYNSCGQLGTGDTQNRTSFTRVLDNVYLVAGGSTHSLAVTTDNAVWATGDNQFGQLGLGNYDEKHVFTRVVPASSRLSGQISAGAYTTFIQTSTASLLVAGRNREGQLGLNSNRDTIPSLTTAVQSARVRRVAAGWSCGFYVNGRNGNLYAAGSNASGQLGTGDGRDYIIFTQTGR